MIGLEIQSEKSASSSAQVFAELYERNLPKVFRYVNYRIRNTSLAEDLTSAVFEKALTGFRKYCSERASFSTWILSIARNTVIDYYRVSARKQTAALEEAAEMTDGPSPEDEAIKNEERHRLQVCLARLSTGEQEIISLKFGAESTNREIARILGLSESNVGVKLYWAICKLRNCFEEG